MPPKYINPHAIDQSDGAKAGPGGELSTDGVRIVGVNLNLGGRHPVAMSLPVDQLVPQLLRWDLEMAFDDEVQPTHRPR